jgi:hypothetical protein
MDIAIISSTDATTAATAIQPRTRAPTSGLAGGYGSPAGGAAGEPVVAVVKPVSTRPHPYFDRARLYDEVFGGYPKGSIM